MKGRPPFIEIQYKKRLPSRLPAVTKMKTGTKENFPWAIRRPKRGRTISAGTRKTVALSKKDDKKIPAYPVRPMKSADHCKIEKNSSGIPQFFSRLIRVNHIYVHAGAELEPGRD